MAEERNMEEETPVITNTQVNDNSNPQQGAGSERKHEPNAQAMKLPPTAKDDRKLFVGGLPADVTDQEFRMFFEQFGIVIDSVVMFDRETKNSRGFGFVTFADPEISDSLLKMGNHSDGIGRLNMRGKTCEVKRAQPKHAGRPIKGRSKIPPVLPHLYSHEAFHGNNNMLPFQGNLSGYPGYMAPMFYPPMGPPMTIPPPPPTEFVAAPGYYNMMTYTDYQPVYPNAPAHQFPHPQANPMFAPMQPPPPGVAPGPSSQISVMQPVAPGIPIKNEGDMSNNPISE